MAADTHIRVSHHVKERVDEIKEERDHTTHDSALRDLIREAGYEV